MSESPRGAVPLEGYGMDGRYGVPKVRIVVPRADRLTTAHGTRVFTDDGREVRGVLSIKISELRPSEIVTAQIELALDGLEIEAHPLLGLDTLALAAAAHGLRLVDADGAEVAAPSTAGEIVGPRGHQLVGTDGPMFETSAPCAAYQQRAGATDAGRDAWVSGLDIADAEAVGLIVRRLALECHEFALSRGIASESVEDQLGLVFSVLERNSGDLLRIVPVAAGGAADIAAVRIEFSPEGYRRIADAAVHAVAAPLN